MGGGRNPALPAVCDMGGGGSLTAAVIPPIDEGGTLRCLLYAGSLLQSRARPQKRSCSQDIYDIKNGSL